MHGTGTLATFIRAVRNGDLDSVRAMAAADPALVRATDPGNFGSTALISAAGAENREVVDLLLELGADVNQRSDWWAGSFGVLDSGSDEMAAYLLSRGAALTPHAAARLGMVGELRGMLRADPSVVGQRGGDGQTPLHFARTPEIVDLLLEHGAEIDARDIDHGSTPAQWLGGSRPETAAHLAARGAAADPFLAVRVGDVSLLERLVKAEPEGVAVRVSRERFPAPPPAAGHIYLYTIGEGCTLVHAAAWGDRPEVIGALLDSGADIDALSGSMHRNEPIGWAIVSGAVGAFRVLLERGARLRRAHLDDARAGVEGRFREYNPRRPSSAWAEIAQLLAGRDPA